MSELISRLRAARALTALDAELTRSLSRLSHEDRDEVLLAVALASRATHDGHVCADLRKLAGSLLNDEEDRIVARCPPLGPWRESVLASALVGDGSTRTPLVMDSKSRLYLRRQWEHEQRLALALTLRASRAAPLTDPSASRRLLSALFGPPGGETDWQRIAAEIAAVSSLTVVSGGPGTGKTSTVTKIMALAVADELSRGNKNPRALLVAPTGKAASRLAEAARNAITTLDCPEDVLAKIPVTASTVHRALEADSEGRLRITADRPLVADIVAVDEASMIDVALMRALVDAVPPQARLVLLGDRHQLASVEAGAVLADVCGDPAARRYSEALDQRLDAAFGERLPAAMVSARPAGIDDSIVTLTKSHRFAKESPLGELSRAIQHGDSEAVLGLLRSGRSELALLEPESERRPHRTLSSVVTAGFKELTAAKTAEAALAALTRFRVLSAHRRGPFGVEEMNRVILRYLEEAKLLSPRGGLLYPVIVNRNEPSIELFNGDVGVLFREGADSARAAFLGADGGVRRLSPSRLPAHEPAFAMSIHKSQGSELDEVVVILPPPGSPLLSRELFYTAVTRARRRVVVHATAESVREATAHPVERASGLSDALRG